jgi:hypothetical protein
MSAFLLGALICIISLLGMSGWSSAQPMEWGMDRPGQDYFNFVPRSADPGECQRKCVNDRRCKAWTYVQPNTIQGPQPRCWLKYGVPRQRQDPCCVSGVK